jgi:hypothetical protein
MAVEGRTGDTGLFGDGTHRRRRGSDGSVQVDGGLGDPLSGRIHACCARTEAVGSSNFGNTLLFSHIDSHVRAV